MSIIEKAMRKLSSGGSQLPRPTTRAASPNVLEHPASNKNSEQPDQPMPLAEVPPQALPTHQVASIRRIARLRVSDAVADDNLVAEEFRRIKRPLLANAYGRGALQVDRGNLIMVTSSLPGEGKSRTSLNLAYSIALEPDHTVLLIDSDVAKAQTSRMYGLEKEPGLTNILSQHLSPEGLIWATDNIHVSILPVGNEHSRSTELLNSRQMEDLIARLTKQDPSRLIIFDAPPLLATNEPQALAHLVGQIVLVVEAGRTPQHVVKEAISALDPTKAIGLVLNKSQYTIGGDYYGHYYGGYHGYGAERHKEENDKGGRR